ncbi:MAG: hypothetical protein ACUVQ8_08260 [Nitrososphaeria archaeon]
MSKSLRDLKVNIERSFDGRISKIEAGANFMERLEKLANKDAVEHYRLMISNLREKNIKPYACLNHFTLSS